MFKLNEDEYKFVIDLEEIYIRAFRSSDSVNEITNLLHRSYKQLADMGFRYVATHQDDSETEKRLKGGISYVALSEGKIISTVTLYKNSKNHKAEWYRHKNIAHFGQYAVLPGYQNKGLGNFMMTVIENKAKVLGAIELALDTSEGADHLIQYYEKRGYRFIDYINWEVTNYRSVIMSKNLNEA